MGWLVAVVDDLALVDNAGFGNRATAKSKPTTATSTSARSSTTATNQSDSSCDLESLWLVAVVDDLALVDVAVVGLDFAVALLPKPALLLHYLLLDCHWLVFLAYCNDQAYSTYRTDMGKKTAPST